MAEIARTDRLAMPPHRNLGNALDPLSAPCGGLEWIGKILRFPGDLVAAELHDAHGVRRLAVISQDVLGDPKITTADDSPHCETLFARLLGAGDLYVASTVDSLARLWVIQHRVLVIDGVLRFEIVRIGRRPMPIQRRPYLLVSHRVLPRSDSQSSRPQLQQLRERKSIARWYG